MTARARVAALATLLATVLCATLCTALVPAGVAAAAPRTQSGVVVRHDPQGDTRRDHAETLRNPGRADLRSVRYEVRGDRFVVTGRTAALGARREGVARHLTVMSALTSYKTLFILLAQHGTRRARGSVVVVDEMAETQRYRCVGEARARLFPRSHRWRVSVPVSCLTRIAPDGVLPRLRSRVSVQEGGLLGPRVYDESAVVRRYAAS